MNYKNLLPHVLAIAVLLVIALVYFLPILQGKQIMQHDIAQWEGMSKEIQDYRENHEDEPLWTRSMFGGMPAYQISVLYPANLMKYADKVITLGLPTPVNYIFLALLGFYILLVSLKIDYRLAAAGALGFAFASYNLIIIMAGHNSKMHAIAIIPFVLTGILMILRGKILFGTALTAFFLALEIYANHFQITYYLALFIIILFAYEFAEGIRQGQLNALIRKSAALSVAVIMAILPNVTGLWATYEYGKYTTRGPSELSEYQESSGLDKDYALRWSYGKMESFNILIPNFMGGPSQSELGKNSATYRAMVRNGAGGQAGQFVKQTPLYWGDQPITSGPNYNGAVLIFLFVLGLFTVKGRFKWWLLSSTVFFLILSWGKNFLIITDLFFNYFPGYNKFRAVSMMLSMLAISIPLLGICGIAEAGNIEKKNLKKHLFTSFYIVGGISLLFLLVPKLSGGFYGPVDDQFNSEQYQWLIDAIREDRSTILRLDALRSLVLVAIAFALIYFHLVKSKISSSLFGLSLALLILVDMWFVDKRYLDNDDFMWIPGSEVHQPTQIDNRIMSDPELGFRVMNTSVSTFNDASTSYFHHSIGGYHGAKLRRYQELIERQISKNNMAVLDMLNTKYFILPSRDGTGNELQINPGALGSAWYVKKYEVVDDADAEIEALTGFDPSETAIVDKRFADYLEGLKIDFDSSSTIELINYLPNELIYETSSRTEQLAVFSEIYYPMGWKVLVDDEPAEHIRVNYVLRALKVPPGNHKITFRFKPEVYSNGERISLAGSLIVLLFFAFTIIRETRNS